MKTLHPFFRLENRSRSGSNSSATFLGEDSSLQAAIAAKPDEGREKKMEEQEAEGREEVEGGKEEEGSSFSSGESSHSTVSGSSIINWNFADFRS
jgi:hypothetical protein